MAVAYKLGRSLPHPGAIKVRILPARLLRNTGPRQSRADASRGCASWFKENSHEIAKRSKPVPNGMSIQTPVPWRSVVRFLPHVLAMCVAQRIERQENVFPLV